MIYTRWQATIVPEVNDIVEGYRAELLSTASTLSAPALVLAFAPSTLGDFIQDFDQVFAGLTPFFLFAGPAVVLLFRHRPLVWLISSSTVAYLAVMSVPLLAIPYVYLTVLRDSSHSDSQRHLLRLSACGGVRLRRGGRDRPHRSHSPAATRCGSQPVACWRCSRHFASIGAMAVSLRR